MTYTPKERTWQDNWGDTIRLIYKDAKMRE